MKKFLCLATAMVILFAACSSSQKSESLPDHIVGKNYELTRMEQPWVGETVPQYTRYIGYSEKDVVEKSSFIVKVEIIEDPVEYTVNFEGERGTKEKQMSQVYSARISKIFYSEYADINEGDIISIARCDYYISEQSTQRYIDSIYIKTHKDNSYILFLDSLENMQKIDEGLAKQAGITPQYYYKAMDDIADFAIISDFQGIIHCVGNTYEFSEIFETLGKNAEVMPSTISPKSNITHFFITDEKFDVNMQLYINTYNTSKGE